MFEYLLTIRVPFKTEDDVDARREAKTMLENSTLAFKDKPEIKLQRLNPGKPPDKIEI